MLQSLYIKLLFVLELQIWSRVEILLDWDLQFQGIRSQNTPMAN
jgi:hypothetical protein